MSNSEKLEALKAFLKENGIEYEENHWSHCKTMIDLQIKRLMIAVHLSDDSDEVFHDKVKRHYKPFFIRDNESIDFILEKMQNCIVERMVWQQKQWEKKQKKEK